MSKQRQGRGRDGRGQRSRRGADDRITIGGPHAVAAALDGAAEVEAIYVETGASPRCEELATSARADRISVSSVAKGECDGLAGVRCQGIAALIRYAYADLSDVVSAEPDLIIFLDGIEDPHNLGAIIRTAEAAGAAAVVVPGRRSAVVTAAVIRASAGAAVYLPVCRVTNLVQAMRTAREAGFWLVGIDHRADEVLAPAPADRPHGLVIGAEGSGLGRLVTETCDELAKLPMVGRVESLNASVAAAVAIYRLRQPALFGNS